MSCRVHVDLNIRMDIVVAVRAAIDYAWKVIPEHQTTANAQTSVPMWNGDWIRRDEGIELRE